MAFSSGSACVLTFISGNFDGADAWVRAYVASGRWWLEGSRANKQLEVRARCINNLSFMTTEYSWNQNDGQPILLGSFVGLSCGFTFMQGNFKGGGESVQIYPAGVDWYLGGDSQQNDVAAKARCFPVPWSLSASASLPQGG
ncbi:hypothetical protein [Hyalangium versicolor]|uniref:hypothetical protein n=1 Tax=Hyalangium versicolor TaxID=2861190 RepID=UPI001CC9F7E3|nr:hypothetical protein [Hyalangium versicolor]